MACSSQCQLALLSFFFCALLWGSLYSAHLECCNSCPCLNPCPSSASADLQTTSVRTYRKRCNKPDLIVLPPDPLISHHACMHRRDIAPAVLSAGRPAMKSCYSANHILGFLNKIQSTPISPIRLSCNWFNLQVIAVSLLSVSAGGLIDAVLVRWANGTAMEQTLLSAG